MSDAAAQSLLQSSAHAGGGDSLVALGSVGDFVEVVRSTDAQPDVESDSASDVDPTDIDEYYQRFDESALQFLRDDREEVLNCTSGLKPTFSYDNLGRLRIPQHIALHLYPRGVEGDHACGHGGRH